MNILLGNIVYIWGSLEMKRKIQFLGVVSLAVISSFAEMFSIGLTIPFLSAITSPDKLWKIPYAEMLLDSFGVETNSDLIIFFAALFGVFAIFAGICRLFLLRSMTELTFTVGADLNSEIFRRVLYQQYSFYALSNSSRVIDVIGNKINGVIYNVLMPLLILATNTILLIVFVGTLLALQPIITVIAFCIFISFYLTIALITKGKVVKNSQIIAEESVRLIKLLQESLGGIRDILLDGSQKEFLKRFELSDRSMRRAQGNAAFVGQAPRYLIETFSLILIAFGVFYASNEGIVIVDLIPIFGALALASQRILPILQQMYGAWTSISTTRISLGDVVEFLRLPECMKNSQKIVEIKFQKDLEFEGINFGFSTTLPLILENVNLKVLKGDRIGFVGNTGGGKSTLVDLIMGLLSPLSGSYRIDGIELSENQLVSWQKKIAHVPQSIYLLDATIAENIAFGVPFNEINYDLLRSAASDAKIIDDIELMPIGFNTIVGERGARLSGGQRQRIGIARAFYKKFEILILDEATSALDDETEAEVMDSIYKSGRNTTIFIIAHRKSTLSKCDQVYRVENRKLALLS